MDMQRGLPLKWRIGGGLALLGLVLYAAAPSLVGAVLPLLLVAACPLMMVFMMKGMHGGQSGQGGHRSSQPGETRQPARAGLNRDERLAELKAQLASVQTRQEAIAREVAELEGEDSPTVRQPEAVARAAEQRAPAPVARAGDSDS